MDHTQKPLPVITGTAGGAFGVVGKWITCGSRMERHPIFSKRIIPRGKVKKARLYLCGLGLYEAYFTDGEKTETDILKSAKIGEEYLTPYCNNYNQWLQYQTYV